MTLVIWVYGDFLDQSPWSWLALLSTPHFSSCCLAPLALSSPGLGAGVTQEVLDAGLIENG